MALIAVLGATQPGASAASPDRVAGQAAEDGRRPGLGPGEPAAASAVQLGPAIRAHRLSGLRPEVVGALLSSDRGGELPIEALALASAWPGGERPSGSDGQGLAPVTLFVEIDGADFLRHNQAEVARVEVYVYAVAEGARVAGHLAEMFAVDVATLGEAIWRSGLRFHGVLRLAPGSYELRVMVRNHQSGARGLRRIRVVVPPYPAAAPSEAAGPEGVVEPPPLLTFPGPLSRDAWVAVESAGDRGPRIPYPFVVDGVALGPAARAVLLAGRQAQGVVFAGARSGASEARQLPALMTAPIEFAPEAGPSAEDRDPTAVATAEGRLDWAADGLSARLEFVVPELAPGRYRARLAGTPSPSATTAPRRPTPWAPVAIVGEHTRERELLWTDLRWMLQERPKQLAAGGPGVAGGTAAAADPDSLTSGRQAGRAVRRMAARYRGVLRELGSAPERARAALLDLESEVLGRGDRRAQLRLRAAERSVAEELATRDPEATVPLMLLHSELAEQYRARRVFSLVSHSRAMVEIIAELHAASGGSATLTAQVLAIQGSYLQQANLVAGSRRLFRRALEHDPESASALLCLAASYEKYADYNSAIELLERLVPLRPELDEASLRLAVNQARVGRVGRSRQALAAIAARDRRDWVSGLAFEELARTYLIAGDLAQAVSILEPAIERMPRRAGLRFLLAHLYDRQGRVREALALVAGIDVVAGAGPSARRRYDEWPGQLVAGDLRLLGRRAEGATARLMAGLELEGRGG